MSNSPSDTSPLGELERWIAEARQGSSESLGKALDACRRYLLLVANQSLPLTLRGKVGASDVVHDTFLKAVGEFNRFQGHTEAELLAWLKRILVNSVLNLSQSYQTGKRQAEREQSLEGDPAAGAAFAVADNAASPEQQAMAREQDELLERALDKLPEDYRQVIRLREWERLDFAAIAQRLGRPSADAARKLWARAVERLAELLESGDAQQ